MKTNRLAGEKSPYLLQHQTNPVDWYPWGEAAFQKAKNEKKPIFLSIGYSTCHWCHVMAHESFENEQVAEFLNEHFVSIKVDREERPDVDRVYMTFVQATTGSGGWPMTVFLTPDLKPFLGGTYFPPTDRYGRVGFLTLLKRIHEAWENDSEKLLQQGEQMASALQEYGANQSRTDALVEPGILQFAYAQFNRSFDPEWGGFGSSPKFPRPSVLNFLTRFYAQNKDSEHGSRALEIALFTLQKMAEGGMNDHIGGGFHRYSVDTFWHIPHFEKMLYDQAQLANAYIDAFQITHKPFYKEIAESIFQYVTRDLAHPEGGFYSAEDADSLFEHGRPEHGEGVFYVWGIEEINSLLNSENAAIFNAFYGVEANGNAPAGSDPHGEFTGKNTLIQRLTIPGTARQFGKTEKEIETLLVDSRDILFEARKKRPRPHLDDKILTAWNGLMISAFARGYQVFENPAHLENAQKAALFIRANLYNPDEKILYRSYRQGRSDIPGFADDYAFLIQGLLDLYEADFDSAWLRWAIELQEIQDQLFLDTAGGGYFSTSGKDPNLILRMKEDNDGAEPSPNSISALNLLRLAQLLDRPAWNEQARKTIRAFSTELHNYPTGLPQMLTALDFSGQSPRQIVLTGALNNPKTTALLKEIRSHFIPVKTVLFAEENNLFLKEQNPFLKNLASPEPAVFVCRNYTCELPVSDPETLKELLLK